MVWGQNIASLQLLARETRRRLGQTPYWRRPIELRTEFEATIAAFDGDVGEPLVVSVRMAAQHDAGTLDQLVTRHVWPQVIDALEMD